MCLRRSLGHIHTPFGIFLLLDNSINHLDYRYAYLLFALFIILAQYRERLDGFLNVLQSLSFVAFLGVLLHLRIGTTLINLFRFVQKLAFASIYDLVDK